MNEKQCMIVDLEKEDSKQKFITDQVASIKKNENGHWTVRFITSPRVFQYNQARLLYFTQPEAIDIQNKGVYINNRRISDVAELLRFKQGYYCFYHITYNNGYAENLDGKNVYITRTPLNEIGGSTWDYLLKLAEETGLCDEEGNNILYKGYSLIDTKRDNVPLAQYLGNNDKVATYSSPKQIYYPFGCNASQKRAVESALTHQVSIIQGPPGTGKTQTILNIIANLLLENKSVLVVSNNNSAAANVAEKLQKEGLGFIVAMLGNTDNKESFIEQQTSRYPNMQEWLLKDAFPIRQLAKASLQTVSEGLDDQVMVAKLKAELQSLSTEKQYSDSQNQIELPRIEWLCKKPSKKLLKLLALCEFMHEQSHTPNLWFRLKWSFILGPQAFFFLKGSMPQVKESLRKGYYHSRKTEIEQALTQITERLDKIDLNDSVKMLTKSSLQFLKHEIARRYKGVGRQLFSYNDIKHRTGTFLKEYPIVLSSTYKSNSNISQDYVFDYVIMDEASQVDIKTGALALSCAINAVIVGDDKQLPNVVTQEERLALDAIRSCYNVPDCYNATKHSFLKSCTEIFKDAPTTLLREHYRCHPKIIEFCNQRFYDGELIPMTKDRGEKNVLQVVRTVKGNHARGHFNQREIDVIVQEILPKYTDQSSVGIITPYRDQALAINQVLGKDLASTVHKYQGRECDTIIMSMVDNAPTEFSDDPNLFNVAISRAKTHLCIVTTGNDLPKNTNLAQLIDYIQYNNFAVTESKLQSVFDLLYQQYTTERLAYQAEHPQISESLSENLLYNTLEQALKDLQLYNLSIVCHYPLSKLISDLSLLNLQEQTFVESAFSHVDFLIYNHITKRPLRIIEVDGWHYHKDSTVQQARDNLKDSILSKYNLPLCRISTTDTVTLETVKALLEGIHE